jgi:uncharacterized membrane-anchored protein
MNKKLIFFVLAVLVQCVVLVAVPGRQIYTRLTGKVITVHTRPVDPYDVMSGYYVTLAYDIGRMGTPSDWQKRESWQGKDVYVTLKEGNDKIWVTDSVSLKRPSRVPEGMLLIKGTSQYWGGVIYGIERFYIPEEKRDEIDSALRKTDSKAKVQIAVDRFGNAAILRLEAGGKIYEY